MTFHVVGNHVKPACGLGTLYIGLVEVKFDILQMFRHLATIRFKLDNKLLLLESGGIRNVESLLVATVSR